MMKTSFYFVLWALATQLVILLDIPDKYLLFSAAIIYTLAALIIGKLLNNQIEYQKRCETAVMLEMAYNNDYKRYKQQVFLQMILSIAIFVCALLAFIALFTDYSDTPLIDYIIIGAVLILISLYSPLTILCYIQTVKAGKVILNKELQDLFQNYKTKRDTCIFEEMLLPRPKHFQAMNTANIAFAVLSIVIGLLFIIITYIYREQDSNILMFIYGILAVYFGVKDLLSTSSKSKVFLLIFSCVFLLLLYMPLVDYLNRVSLAIHLAESKSIIYDVKTNLVKVTDTADNITDIEPTYRKKSWILALSGKFWKEELLEKMIRVNAEYQIIYRDSLGKELAITIAPSELKEIYHQNKSDLDIRLEVLKLALENLKGIFDEAKVYEDGEYIIVELWKDEIPTQWEQTTDSIWLAKFAESYGTSFNIPFLNRGIKMRLVFSNHYFIEHTLSIEELRELSKEDL